MSALPADHLLLVPLGQGLLAARLEWVPHHQEDLRLQDHQEDHPVWDPRLLEARQEVRLGWDPRLLEVPRHQDHLVDRLGGHRVWDPPLLEDLPPARPELVRRQVHRPEECLEVRPVLALPAPPD